MKYLKEYVKSCARVMVGTSVGYFLCQTFVDPTARTLILFSLILGFAGVIRKAVEEYDQKVQG